MLSPCFLKDKKAIASIRKGGQLLSNVHREIASQISPGITTEDLDQLAEGLIIGAGAKPSFKGYQGFPATLCTSVNHEVVHGLPTKQKLVNGDLVTIDCGLLFEGYHTDAAYTYGVGRVDKARDHLLEVTKSALLHGIKAAKGGGRIGDIGFAIQHYVAAYGLGLVKQYGGHGIGKKLHELPEIPNFGRRGSGVLIKEGMMLAIEPIVNMGGEAVVEDPKTGVVLTRDQMPSAHFEQTIVIVDGLPECVTPFDFNIK